MKNILYLASLIFIIIVSCVSENKLVEGSSNQYYVENKLSFFNPYEIVYSNYNIYDESKKKRFIKFKKVLPSGMVFKQLLRNYTVGIVTICLRSNLFKDNSFNDNFDIIGDFDLFLKFSENKKIWYMHDILAEYRLHKSNLSKKKN